MAKTSFVDRFVVDAFHAEYVDAHDTVNEFIHYVDECHAEYKRNTDKYVAPYVCLCQSSGYGKSRLLKEVAKRRKLLYIGMGDSDFSFPGPNRMARDMVCRQFGHLEREENLAKLLERCVSWALQHDDLTNMEQFGECRARFWHDIFWPMNDDEDDETTTEVVDDNNKEAEELLLDDEEESGTAAAAAASAATASSTPKSNNYNEWFRFKRSNKHQPKQQQQKKKQQKQKQQPSQHGETIWIALDEARSLLEVRFGGISDLQLLQSVLPQVSKKLGHCVFVILADTKFSIANLPRYETNEDDVVMEKKTKKKTKNVFHPYLLLLTHDVLKDSSDVDFTDEWSFVGCSRPLWKALYPNPAKSQEDMFEYAAEKLSKIRYGYVIENKNELALLAIVICRLGVNLSPQSPTACDLAANHMATIFLCDYSSSSSSTHDEHYLLVNYFSDPVLTIAGAILWYVSTQKDLLVQRGLPLLRKRLLDGTVVERYRGESVGKLLLLIGMDKTNPESGYYDGKWYKVSDFMKCCFGIPDCMVGEEAFVGFSHFIQYNNEPTTYQALKDLLFRRGACCLPAEKDGANLLIPFWKTSSNDDDDDKKKKEPLLVSYMLIQIKNHSISVPLNEIVDELNPEDFFADGSELQIPSTDIISIMMQIGLENRHQDVRSSVVIVEEDKDDKEPPNVVAKKNWVYSVHGISPQSYPFLLEQHQLKDELDRLRKGSRMNAFVDEWTELAEPGMQMQRAHIRHVIQ